MLLMVKMMKTILISIRPEWCKLIAERKKTLEIRKTKPKIKTPFKAFIYETKSIDKSRLMVYIDGNEPCRYYKGVGMVIGEFICDEIINIDVPYPAYQNELDENILKHSCMTYIQLHQYAGKKRVYGFHISNVVIYNEPKELSDFLVHKDKTYDCPTLTRLKNAPQSWCYVEEV